MIYFAHVASWGHAFNSWIKEHQRSNHIILLQIIHWTTAITEVIHQTKCWSSFHSRRWPTDILKARSNKHLLTVEEVFTRISIPTWVPPELNCVPLFWILFSSIFFLDVEKCWQKIFLIWSQWPWEVVWMSETQLLVKYLTVLKFFGVNTNNFTFSWQSSLYGFSIFGFISSCSLNITLIWCLF